MNFLARNINLFKQTSARGKNDADNKIRESFFLIGNDPLQKQAIFDDPEFGASCKELYEKFEATMNLTHYDSYKMKQMAGRKYNFDFLMEVEKNEEIKEKKLEFKFGNNAKSIANIPQFQQKNTTWDIFVNKYHDHFYDGTYLSEIIDLNATTNESSVVPVVVPIPSKEEYMKHIMKTNYDCNPFFKYLKETEDINKVAKQTIVKRSIMEYLAKNAESINIDRFKHTIIETQSNKEYLLYDLKTEQFYLDKIDTNLETLKFDRVECNNKIVLKTEKNEFSLLLRWKNHIGILNPAWQVSVKEHKATKAVKPDEP